MKRAGILVVGCALAMSTGAFAQTSAPGQIPPGGSGRPGTAGPGAPAPIGSGTDRTMPTVDQSQARANDVQDFVKKAAMASMAEVQLGQLAESKAESPEVKAFAKKMVDEHTKALEELRQSASASGATLPTELDKKHQKKHDKLSKLSGPEFDRKYMEAMVDSHKDVAKMLEKQSKRGGQEAPASAAPVGTSGSTGGTTASGTSATATATGTSGAAEAGITEWASKTLPSVQGHLQEAEQLERSLEAKTDNSAPRAPGTTGAGDTGAGTTPTPGSTTGAGSTTGGNTPPE